MHVVQSCPFFPCMRLLYPEAEEKTELVLVCAFAVSQPHIVSLPIPRRFVNLDYVQGCCSHCSSL